MIKYYNVMKFIQLAFIEHSIIARLFIYYNVDFCCQKKHPFRFISLCGFADTMTDINVSNLKSSPLNEENAFISTN